MASRSQSFASFAQTITLLGLLLAMLDGPQPQGIHAWGTEGHQAVAQLAYNYLTASARQKTDAVLQAAGFRDISDASTWPDRVRPQRPNTGPWHYVGKSDNPPAGKCTLTFPADCVNSDCVITAIADQTKIAASPQSPAQARGEALAFVVHLVGDVAQPLHASGYQRGGNGVPVLFNKKPTNLHSVWDGAMLKKTIAAHGSFAAYMQYLLTQVPPQPQALPGIACIARIDPPQVKTTQRCATEWAQDANALVCKVAYPSFFKPGMETATNYYVNAKNTVDEQVLLGGIRLATLLNKIFA